MQCARCPLAACPLACPLPNPLLVCRPAGKVDEHTKEKMVRAFYPYHPRTDKLIAARNWWVAGCGRGLWLRRCWPARMILLVVCCAVHACIPLKNLPDHAGVM